MALGPHGVLTPAQARTRAQEILSAVRMGRDPAKDREVAREALTLRQFADRFIEEDAKPRSKPSTVRQYQKLLDGHILPRLGSKKLGEITRVDAQDLHSSIRGHPFQANRAVGLLRTMLNVAVRWGQIAEGPNPCRHVKYFPEPKRERFLSDDEIGRLGKALREVAQKSPDNALGVAAIRLLALTGARRNEILTLRWDFVDWTRRELQLPDSKTGKKAIALNAPARQILRELQELAGGSPWVFPGSRDGEHRKDLKGPWYAARTAAGLEGLRLHDLRHTYASVGARSGLGLPLIGAILGQSQATTTERYSHLDNDPVHAANEAVGARIAAHLDATESGEIVHLGKK